MLKPLPVSTADIRYPPSKEQKIKEINMRAENGDFTLTSGIIGDIGPGHLRMLNGYEFDQLCQFTSRGATNEWVMYGENVWNSMAKVSVANFYGEYPNDLICNLVSKCTNVYSLSFTYWKAPFFENVIASIQSKNLIELTAHVSGTNSATTTVLERLNGHGTIMNWKLERLMLFFAEDYNGIDIAKSCNTDIGGILSSNAIVYIFIQNENPSCMDTLARVHHFSRAGYINVAKNYETVTLATETMEFERYYLYQKIINGITFLVGVKKQQNAGINLKIPPMNSSPTSLKDESRFIVDRDVFEIHHESQCHASPEFIEGFALGHWGDEEYRNYNPAIYEHDSTSSCCCPKRFLLDIEIDRHYYHAPIWDVTMVTCLAYLEKDTRFLFSNGLIFQLAVMKLETAFFKMMQKNACPRLQIYCSTQDRRWIQAVGLEEFLSNVKYVEFSGAWFADPAINILERLPLTLNSICMMRMKFDKWPSIYYWRKLNDQTCESISKLSIDYRDTIEISLASAMNGFLKQEPRFNNLESLVICARAISDPNYRTTLYEFVDQCVGLTDNGAEITIVVHEKFDRGSAQTLNLRYPIDVLVQGIFSSWTNDFPKCMVMVQYFANHRDRVFNIIVPKNL